MNRTDLEAKIADRTGLSRKDAGAALTGALDTIKEALAGGDDVRLVGFGTFSVSETSAREGRNPRTGEKLQIAASKQAKFKAGKELTDAVRG